MHHSIQVARPLRRLSGLPWLVAGMALLLALLAWQHLAHQRADHQLKMEKASGRNGKHANEKAREAAERQLEKLKQGFDKLNAKTSKTKSDNAALQKLDKQLKHWRKKKDWKGENHSRKHKGN